MYVFSCQCQSIAYNLHSNFPIHISLNLVHFISRNTEFFKRQIYENTIKILNSFYIKIFTFYIFSFIFSVIKLFNTYLFFFSRDKPLSTLIVTNVPKHVIK